MSLRCCLTSPGCAFGAALMVLSAAAAPAGAQADAKAAAPVSASAGAAKTTPDTAAITPAMIAQGRAVFHGAGNCQACHGPALAGTPIAPTLLAHRWKDAAGGSFAEIYRVVGTGVPGTAMVAHPGGLNDALALAVAAYVWSVGHGHAKP